MDVVWVIDADHWPRAMLRAELIERGFDAVGYETTRDAMDSVLSRKPDAIVVDARGQPAEQIARLTEIGVPVIVIVGQLDEIANAQYAEVVHRPVSIGEIADRIATHCRRQDE